MTQARFNQKRERGIWTSRHAIFACRSEAGCCAASFCALGGTADAADRTASCRARCELGIPLRAGRALLGSECPREIDGENWESRRNSMSFFVDNLRPG